jgi:hypothetical protein
MFSGTGEILEFGERVNSVLVSPQVSASRASWADVSATSGDTSGDSGDDTSLCTVVESGASVAWSPSRLKGTMLVLKLALQHSLDGVVVDEFDVVDRVDFDSLLAECRRVLGCRGSGRLFVWRVVEYRAIRRVCGASVCQLSYVQLLEQLRVADLELWTRHVRVDDWCDCACEVHDDLLKKYC